MRAARRSGAGSCTAHFFCKMIKADPSVTREQQGGADTVVELANIPWPSIGPEGTRRVECEGDDVRAIARVMPYPRGEYQAQVFTALAQRRQPAGEAGDSVVQIVPKAVLGHEPP